MTPPYRWVGSRQAFRDLNRIHDDVARSSSTDVARLVAQRIVDAFGDPMSTPHRNVVDPQLASRRPTVRSMPVPPYIVYFRVYDADRVVRITRVRHGARRPLRRFD